MPTEFKFQILWSTRNKPFEIRKMMSDERINELITSGRWRCKIGSFNIRNQKDPEIEMTVVEPTDPHGYISDIYLDDDEEKWYGDIAVPSTKTDWIYMIQSKKSIHETKYINHPMANRQKYSYTPELTPEEK